MKLAWTPAPSEQQHQPYNFVNVFNYCYTRLDNKLPLCHWKTIFNKATKLSCQLFWFSGFFSTQIKKQQEGTTLNINKEKYNVFAASVNRSKKGRTKEFFFPINLNWKSIKFQSTQSKFCLELNLVTSRVSRKCFYFNSTFRPCFSILPATNSTVEVLM